MTTLKDDPGDTFPIPRDKWPTKAHAPDVLTFELGDRSFKDLDPVARRRMFVNFARDTIDLGKGSSVVPGGKKGTPTEDHPLRPVAYCDAVAMGESAKIRTAFLGDTGRASSCGMFVRNLYKMIGVMVPEYAAPYKPEQVIAKEEAFAKTIGARIVPGTKEIVDGVSKLRVPQKGDAVYMHNGKKGDESHQHMFVVEGWDDETMKRNGDLTQHNYTVLAYHSLQGGAGSNAEFPADGGCMATRSGTTVFSVESPSVWKHNDLKVQWWIDLDTLVEKGTDGQPYVAPLRHARY